MNKPSGYDSAIAKTGLFENPPAGAYVCKISNVKIDKTKETKKDMMCLALDIEEGSYKGNFKKMFDRMKEKNASAKYPCVYRRVLDQVEYLKGDLLAIEESNTGFKYNWDENTLKGKLVGVIFGEKEINVNGKTVLEPRFLCSSEKARSGNIKAPKKKPFAGNSNSFGYGEDDSMYPPEPPQGDMNF